jgi:hypothetical protein
MTARNAFLQIFLRGFFIIIRTLIITASDSTVPTDAGIEPRTVATDALTFRRTNH